MLCFQFPLLYFLPLLLTFAYRKAFWIVCYVCLWMTEENATSFSSSCFRHCPLFQVKLISSYAFLEYFKSSYFSDYGRNIFSCFKICQVQKSTMEKMIIVRTYTSWDIHSVFEIASIVSFFKNSFSYWNTILRIVFLIEKLFLKNSFSYWKTSLK